MDSTTLFHDHVILQGAVYCTFRWRDCSYAKLGADLESILVETISWSNDVLRAVARTLIGGVYIHVIFMFYSTDFFSN